MRHAIRIATLTAIVYAIHAYLSALVSMLPAPAGRGGAPTATRSFGPGRG
jgi:hypothetical protein